MVPPALVDAPALASAEVGFITLSTGCCWGSSFIGGSPDPAGVCGCTDVVDGVVASVFWRFFCFSCSRCLSSARFRYPSMVMALVVVEVVMSLALVVVVAVAVILAMMLSGSDGADAVDADPVLAL